jgi:hypothetical protein
MRIRQKDERELTMDVCLVMVMLFWGEGGWR